ncbi:putative MFS transporter [Hortaea werneckii]|nr:putative MFS transporter [Hortaea werneckii]
MYTLNYLDRQNIAASKLANIMEDLDMTVQQFNSSVSTLFVGYILMQVPSNLVVSKIRYPAIYICSAVVVWGAISACTAAVSSYGGLLACRFMLGFVEAVFFPVSWEMHLVRFLPSESPNWMAIMVLRVEDGCDFLIEGVLTIGFAIIFACYLPNTPRKIIGFTQQQLDWLRYNYEADQKQEDYSNEITAKQGFIMAVTDPQTWLLCGILYATCTAAAVNNFFPAVVAGLGFSQNKSYGLTAPPFVLCVICMLINGYHSDKTQERFLHIACPLIITVIANIIAVSTLNISARYVAMMLLPASFYSSAIVQLSWISGSLSQPAVKRACAIALINCICNTPNIWTSYKYYDSPRYVAAFAVNLGAAVIAIGMATWTFYYLRRQNAMMDLGRALGKSGPTPTQQAAGFRYLL